MKLHGNARTCPHSRRLIALRVLEQGWTLAQAAEAAGASVRTASKWVARYRAEGEDGLADRSSEPLSSPNRTPEERVEAIAVLRRLRMTGAEIAEVIGMPFSTVSAVLTRIGFGKLSRLEPLEPAEPLREEAAGRADPYRREEAGADREGRPSGHRQPQRQPQRRSAGSTSTSASMTPPGSPTSRCSPTRKPSLRSAFLRRAVAHYAAYGIRVRKLMTDNGPAYLSIVHKLACTTLGIKHSRTRPYRPRTNGKAERFIRTMLGGWAYGAIYGTSSERTAALPGWLDYYNRRRPHGSLSHQPPLTRLHAIRNNVPRSTASCRA